MKRLSVLLLIPAVSVGFLACGRHRLSADEIGRNRLFAEILRREDRRILGSDNFFRKNLETEDYRVAERSAVALGRIGRPEALPWLYRALSSPYAAVRSAAAFAIGEIEDRDSLDIEGRRADPGAVSSLATLLRDASTSVRMRAVEAIGKSGGEGQAASIIRMIEDSPFDGTPGARAFLNLAITALMRLKAQDAFPVLRKLALGSDPDIQWRAANALYRMRDTGARTLYLRLLGSGHPSVRAYAARGLGICGVSEDAALLEPLLLPADARGNPIPLSVRVSALRGLSELNSGNSLPAISKAIGSAAVLDSNPEQMNFAIEAAEVIGRLDAQGGAAALQPLTAIPGPVGCSAVIALARLLRKDPASFFRQFNGSRFSDPPGKRAWARALGELGGAGAVSGLKRMLIDASEPDAGVAEVLAVPTVLQALAKVRYEGLEEILLTYLSSRDGVVVRAAAAAYGQEAGDAAPWEPLIRAYRGIAGADDPETKVALINRLEPWLQEAAVRSFLRDCLEDRQRNARIAAARMLKIGGAHGVPADPGPALTRNTDIAYDLFAAAREERTIAVIETDRGPIEMELFRKDAPLTVANFVSLARAGFFNGLSFMRVVPFFVVQSGDPRNDQEGGPGYSIRCEINMRPFERGSLGMALAGKDTGASQFFITLSPQPHLDGGYTCFGRVISGMTAVDRLVPGDRIKRVRIEEEISILDYRRY